MDTVHRPRPAQGLGVAEETSRAPRRWAGRWPSTVALTSTVSQRHIAARVCAPMNSTPPVPFPEKEERDALILDFQRLAARLTRAGLMSRASSSRLMRSMNNERRHAEDKRHAFPELLLAVLLAVDDDTLKEREHYLRLDNDRVALHLEAVAPALFQSGRGNITVRRMRTLFDFGWLHFREVVHEASLRVRFNREGDRRRTVVIHLPSSRAFVGTRQTPVPVR